MMRRPRAHPSQDRGRPSQIDRSVKNASWVAIRRATAIQRMPRDTSCRKQSKQRRLARPMGRAFRLNVAVGLPCAYAVGVHPSYGNAILADVAVEAVV